MGLIFWEVNVYTNAPLLKGEAIYFEKFGHGYSARSVHLVTSVYQVSLLHCFSSTATDESCSLPNGLPTGSCCTEDNPCYLNEGDCDDDDDCMAGLYCGKDNCPSGFPSTHDCCTGMYVWLFHVLTTLFQSTSVTNFSCMRPVI